MSRTFALNINGGKKGGRKREGDIENQDLNQGCLWTARGKRAYDTKAACDGLVKNQGGNTLQLSLLVFGFVVAGPQPLYAAARALAIIIRAGRELDNMVEDSVRKAPRPSCSGGKGEHG